MKSIVKSILCFEHFSAFGRIANVTNDILIFLHLHALYNFYVLFNIKVQLGFYFSSVEILILPEPK